MGKAIQMVRHTDTSAVIRPNTLNVWDEVDTLTISLDSPSDTSVMNLYMIQFTSGRKPTSLRIPKGIRWVSPPIIRENTVYGISILNNIGVIHGTPIGRRDK